MKISIILFLFTCLRVNVFSQDIPYGNNPSAGKYINVGDARLYYEVYGEGKPLVLLHGGFFGYIDEYAPYIADLSKNFKVIAVATRGHGKSEIGNKEYTERLFAEDILSVLNKETTDSSIIIGFSSGAITALYLAAYYPERIRKVICLAGPINNKFTQPGMIDEMKRLTYQDYKMKYPGFFSQREKLMPQPQRAAEWLQKMIPMWVADTMIEDEKARGIKCKTLIVAGDRDDYNTVEGFVSMYRTIPNAQLAIIPDCNHTCLIFKKAVMINVVMPFLQEEAGK